jgi:FkbM family methyltransferase
MKFTELVKATLLRGLHTANIMLSTLVALLRNTTHLDGITISMDSRLLSAKIKGTIIANTYEYAERQLIQKYLPDEPTIELGGSIGVCACVLNRRLTLPHRHVVVEAHPGLIPLLKKNRALNHCQFHIVEAAISYGSANVTFFSNADSLTGSTYRRGEGEPMSVPATTLQRIAESEGFEYFNLICDIQGSEIDLVDHELTFLAEHTGLLIIEIHAFTPSGEEGMRAVIENLQQAGFEVIDSIDNRCYCLRNRGSLL